MTMIDQPMEREEVGIDPRRAALDAAKARIAQINDREAERLRLAGVKRVRQAKQRAKGIVT